MAWVRKISIIYSNFSSWGYYKGRVSGYGSAHQKDHKEKKKKDRLQNPSWASPCFDSGVHSSRDMKIKKSSHVDSRFRNDFRLRSNIASKVLFNFCFPTYVECWSILIATLPLPRLRRRLLIWSMTPEARPRPQIFLEHVLTACESCVRALWWECAEEVWDFSSTYFPLFNNPAFTTSFQSAQTIDNHDDVVMLHLFVAAQPNIHLPKYSCHQNQAVTHPWSK